MRNSRIDLWLISYSVSNVTDSCAIKQSPSPDHKAVVIEIAMNKKIRGKGYWKMNVSILKDPNYVEEITNLITCTIAEYEKILSKGDLWEYLKVLIKEHSINFSIKKSLARKNEILSLEKKLDIIDKDLENNTDTELSR